MRYMVFAFHSYYPAGGAGDYIGMVDTLEEALALGIAKSDEDRSDYNINVFDLVELRPARYWHCDPFTDKWEEWKHGIWADQNSEGEDNEI